MKYILGLESQATQTWFAGSEANHDHDVACVDSARTTRSRILSCFADKNSKLVILNPKP